MIASSFARSIKRNRIDESLIGASKNTPDPREIPELQPDICEASQGKGRKLLKIKWRAGTTCSVGGPAEVENYHVTCRGATYLNFYVADCCVPGDHWQLKGKNWNNAPNTAVTTSPGPSNMYSVPGRVYSYGSSEINAWIECSYLHGVNMFWAGAYIMFASDGTCSIKKKGRSSRIDRSP